MVNHLDWFKREFDFNLPVWMHPNIIERLRGTPARCEDIVRDLGHERLTRRDGDAWSIQEHIGHLLDLEPLMSGRLDDFEAGRDALRPADLDNVKTHDAGHNDVPLDDILDEFRSVRTGIVRRFEKLADDAIARSAMHPRLQTPMRAIDLALFFAEHDDHHLATISELIRKSA